MTRTIRSLVVSAVVISMAGAVGFAQSGEAVYKSNCQSCHGATGTPSPAMAKMMSIKPASDPEVKKLSADQMFAAVKNGKGKMKPFASKLNDTQIKESVAFFRSLK